MLKTKKYLLFGLGTLAIAFGAFAVLSDDDIETSSLKTKAEMSVTSQQNTKAQTATTSKKITVHMEPNYLYMPLESLSKDSATIVYAEVTNRLDAVKNNLQIEYAVTPIELKVISVLKGDYAKGDIIKYFEDGGETDNTIYTCFSAYNPKVGDKFVIFLNSCGYGWGDQSIYPVKDGLIQVKSEDTSKTPDNSGNVQCTVDEFTDIVKNYQ